MYTYINIYTYIFIYIYYIYMYIYNFANATYEIGDLEKYNVYKGLLTRLE